MEHDHRDDYQDCSGVRGKLGSVLLWHNLTIYAVGMGDALSVVVGGGNALCLWW